MRSSIGGNGLQRRAGTPLHRRLIGLVIGLVDHHGLEVDLLRHGLLAQTADRDLDAEAALQKAVVIAAAQELPRLYELEHFLAGIDADHERLPIGSLE